MGQRKALLGLRWQAALRTKLKPSLSGEADGVRGKNARGKVMGIGVGGRSGGTETGQSRTGKEEANV